MDCNRYRMKTALNTRIDTDLKKQLEAMAKDMGLSLSSLTSMILTRTVKKNSRDYLSDDYTADFFSDTDTQETVFVAKKSGDTRKFLESAPS